MTNAGVTSPATLAAAVLRDRPVREHCGAWAGDDLAGRKPLEYLLARMRDAEADPLRRVRPPSPFCRILAAAAATQNHSPSDAGQRRRGPPPCSRPCRRGSPAASWIPTSPARSRRRSRVYLEAFIVTGLEAKVRAMIAARKVDLDEVQPDRRGRMRASPAPAAAHRSARSSALPEDHIRECALLVPQNFQLGLNAYADPDVRSAGKMRGRREPRRTPYDANAWASPSEGDALSADLEALIAPGISASVRR